MNEQFKTTGFLFDKIKRLYPTFVKPDELDIEVWTEILEGYSQVDILEALKAYRKNVPYDRAPNPATFKGFLQGIEKTGTENGKAQNYVSPADQRMRADIESGNCHHLIGVYQMAVEYVLTDKLIELVGANEWRKMDYQAKYETAMKNGLFDGFDATLRAVCLKNYEKEEQFQSENDLANAKSYHFDVNGGIKTLASHWGLD